MSGGNIDTLAYKPPSSIYTSSNSKGDEGDGVRRGISGKVYRYTAWQKLSRKNRVLLHRTFAISIAKRGSRTFLWYNPVDQGGKSAVTMTRGWSAPERGTLSESERAREGKEVFTAKTGSVCWVMMRTTPA